MLYFCKASAQPQVNFALFGACSVRYLSGLWSSKIVICDPNTTQLKRPRDHITAHASRSMVAHAHCVEVSFWLANATGCSCPVLSLWASWQPTEIALASVYKRKGWPGLAVTNTGASHTFCRKVSKTCCSLSLTWVMRAHVCPLTSLAALRGLRSRVRKNGSKIGDPTSVLVVVWLRAFPSRQLLWFSLGQDGVVHYQSSDPHIPPLVVKKTFREFKRQSRGTNLT